MSAISRKFAGFLGLDDYEPGEIVTIRGKKYKFPSLTDLYHASKGNLAEYRVTNEIPPAQT